MTLNLVLCDVVEIAFALCFTNFRHLISLCCAIYLLLNCYLFALTVFIRWIFRVDCFLLHVLPAITNYSLIKFIQFGLVSVTLCYSLIVLYFEFFFFFLIVCCAFLLIQLWFIQFYSSTTFPIILDLKSINCSISC